MKVGGVGDKRCAKTAFTQNLINIGNSPAAVTKTVVCTGCQRFGADDSCPESESIMVLWADGLSTDSSLG